MNVIFLYHKLTGYFISSVERMISDFDCEVKIIAYNVTEDNPFQINTSKKIQIIKRETFKSSKNLTAYIESADPNIILVSGWFDKMYLRSIFQLRNKSYTKVCCIDNSWDNSMRQLLGCITMGRLISSLFDFAWVPGIYNYELARRVGFSNEEIYTGLYVADTSKFQKAALTRSERHYPHTLLFVGRLLDWKGIHDLCIAYDEISNEIEHDWDLHIVGNGPLRESIPHDNPKIKMTSFVQPEELVKIAAKSGAFCLPSWKDNWGVVLHEFASAGLPIIASDHVGSSSTFLINHYNGFRFKSKSLQSLKNALKLLFLSTDKQLLEMGERSTNLSKRIDKEIWAHTINAMAKIKN